MSKPYGIELPEGWRLRVEIGSSRYSDEARFVIFYWEDLPEPRIDLYQYARPNCNSGLMVTGEISFEHIELTYLLLRIAAEFHKRSRYGRR